MWRALTSSAARRGMATYSERMDKTGRPISPHVMIYAFPTIAWSSVMVRVTGILMTFGASAFSANRPPFPGRVTVHRRRPPCTQLIVSHCLLPAPGTTGIACMALGNSDAPAEFAQNLASSSAAPLAKFAVGFPLTYHYLGAARHAFWDATAKGFTNAQMLQSSYALIGASTAISLALCATSLQPSDKKK
jgi:succinate dehydrogenase (ubiquinone) cytochrome b560 subunit